MKTDDLFITRAWQRIAKELGGHVICQGCGATMPSYPEGCTTRPDVECEGFRTIKAALTTALAAEVGASSQRQEGNPP